jgi:hypothetical protein
MVIRSEIHFQEHTGTLTHKTTQPTEDMILARNAELRKTPGALHDLGAQSGESWGRLLASVPFITINKAVRDGYDLNSRDKEHAALEMARFLKSPEGKACLVQAPGKKYFGGIDADTGFQT